MPVRAALPLPPSPPGGGGQARGVNCRASHPAFTVGLMPKSHVLPPPPPPRHGRLGPGCSGGGGVSGEALPHPPPPQRVLERAEEACLSPGALGEGFKVSHQDVDIFVFLSLQYLKYCHCAWISKQPCEFPCQPVTSFLAARNLCIFIALRSAGIQGHRESGATRGDSCSGLPCRPPPGVCVTSRSCPPRFSARPLVYFKGVLCDPPPPPFALPCVNTN